MDLISKFKAYLKDTDTDLESDEFTRSLIREYCEEEALKTRWKALLEKEYNYRPKANPKSTKKTPLLFIASAVAIAACLLLIWILPIRPAQTDQDLLGQLLSEHYSKPYTRDMTKGPSLDLNIRNEAYLFYQNTQYNQAIPLLEQIIADSSSQQEMDHFFLGLAYLYNKTPEQAAPRFQYLLAQPNSQYEDAATWYLALALTDAGDYAQAKIHLSKVAQWNGNSGKRKLAESARKLLEVIAKK